MVSPVNDRALDVIFRDGRSYNGFKPEKVPFTLIQAVYDLTKLAPTSANCSPARFVFISDGDAKDRLVPFMAEQNQPKVREAPWVVIIAHDMNFADKIPELFPHNPDAKAWFDGNAEETAIRNGTIQSGFFMSAVRALGLDCGPMSGFDMDGVNKAFFEDSEDEAMHSWRANFICNIGYGDRSSVFDRLPRLDFETACRAL